MSRATPPLQLYTLANARGMEVRFSNLGGSIVSLRVPDRYGRSADITPGYDRLEEYLTDRAYLGVLIGRYANRIGNARFELDGDTVQLRANDGPNHLHGGVHGFHRAIWQVELLRSPDSQGAVFSYTSPAGEEGYPGRLQVSVTCTLTDNNELSFDYGAQVDQPSPVNLTQHSYFNLAGHDQGSILDHELQLNSRHYTPIDKYLIPTGEICSVAGTPFDFTQPTPIGARLHAPDEQLQRAGGYDHNFVLAESASLRWAARLFHPASGRLLEISTTEPGIQFYSGNALAVSGKQGTRYGAHSALALETQHFPDSPNRPEFPSTILRPGEALRSRTVYAFRTD